MKEPEFKYGLLAHAALKALLWATIPLAIDSPHYLPAYILFLLFLCFGLRPFLEKTGLYRLYASICIYIGEKRYQRRNRVRREEVEMRKRYAKHNRGHYKNPELPRNW